MRAHSSGKADDEFIRRIDERVAEALNTRKTKGNDSD
jgi:hypothetical protein